MRLRYVAEINPSTPEFDLLSEDESVTFLPLEAVWPGGGLDVSRTRPKGVVSSGYTRFRENDILIPEITPTFEADRSTIARGLRQGIGVGTTELHVLRPGPDLEVRYANYLVSSREFLQGGKAAMKGVAGQQRVPDDWLRDFYFPVSDPTRQNAIADFLDAEITRIDALVTKKRRLRRLLGTRLATLARKLIFAQGNPKKVRLGRVVSILPGYAFSSSDFSNDEKRAIQLLRGINVAPGGCRWEEVVYLPESQMNQHRAYMLSVGDLVLGMYRSFVSDGTRLAIIKETDVPALLVQCVARIRSQKALNPTYLSFALHSDVFKDHCTPITTGVSVPHISGDQIADFRVPLPERKVQDRTAKRLSARRQPSMPYANGSHDRLTCSRSTGRRLSPLP